MTTEYADNASTTLSAPVTATDTSISITSDSGWPAITAPDYLYATIEDTGGVVEEIKVTAHTAASNTLTCDAVTNSFANGSLIEMRLTTNILEELRDHNHDADYADLDKTVDSNYLHAVMSSSSTDAYAADIPTSPGAYTLGLRISFDSNFANTGACSMDLNSLGVKSIKMQNGNDPTDSYISVDSLVNLEYDGTDFILMSPSANNEHRDTSETLTNKTLTTPTLTAAILNGDISAGTSVLDEDDLSTDSDTQVPTQQSVKAYVDNKIVILDTPVQLLSTTTPATSATAIDSATLDSASAIAAIVQITTTAGGPASGSGAQDVWVALGSSSSVALTSVYMKSKLRINRDVADSGTPFEYDSTQAIVNLDGNNDLWYITKDTAQSTSVEIYLVGYYV